MCGHERHWGWVPEDEPVRRFRPTVDQGSIRVSQAERDAVVSQLSKHTGAGRLTLAEFEARVEEAYSATTRAELDHSLRELPRERGHAPRQPRQPRRGWRPPAFFVIVAVILLAMATVWWAMFLLWPGLAWAGGGCGSHRVSNREWDRTEDVIRV